MRSFICGLMVLALVSFFPISAFAGFDKEAWLSPELCTEMVETSNGDDPPKRMEFFVDDLEYLENQWPGYEEELQKLGRAEGVLRYRGEPLFRSSAKDHGHA